MQEPMIPEDIHVEKVEYPRTEPFLRSLKNQFIFEIKLMYRALHSAFADPIILWKRILWPKTVDNGIRPQASWFHAFPDKPNNIAILFCHGFADTPEVFREVVPFFTEKGYYARVIRLSGHATTPGHLAQTTGTEWLASVVWHYKQIRDKYDKIYFIGHSVGGTLGLLLASIYPVDAVATVASPIKLNIPPAKLARPASIFIKYWPRSRRRKRVIDELGVQTYKKSPLFATAGVFDVGTVLRRRAEKLRCPVLYIRSGKDTRSFRKQDKIFEEHFPNTPTTFKVFENAPHSVFISKTKEEVINYILEWFANLKQTI